MDLIQLKVYLRERGVATLQDAAIHFHIDIETIRPLMETWIKKGKLKKLVGVTGKCGGCCKCDPAVIETYEWTS